MDINLYGFEDIEGEPDDFRTFDFEEAAKYARKHNLKIVEHTFEWTEQVDVSGHDYRRQGPPPNRMLQGIPPEGSRIKLGYIERFPHFTFEAGEIAVVKERNFEQGIVWVELETRHDELDEWDNMLSFRAEDLGSDWPTITDDDDRLRLAFWEEVKEVLPETEQVA